MTGHVDEWIPLSQGQRAMWGLQRLDARAGAYNVNHAWFVEPSLDLVLFRDALAFLANRHPFWRALFVLRDGEPWARILSSPLALFQEIDAEDWSEADLAQRLAQECCHGFDLERETPVRWKLFRRARPVLFLQEQHLATDLWSLMRLMGELGRVYTALRKGEEPQLAPARKRHSDFVAAQTALLAGTRGERLRRFWLDRMAGELPCLNLATDLARPTRLGYHGAFLRFEWPSALSKQVTEWADGANAYPAVIYLAAFYALLQRYAQQDELIVGIATPGRTAAFADLVGYFVSPVALRCQVNPGAGFTALVRNLLRVFLDAVRQADYPFANLVADLGGERDLSRSPIFQAQFLWEEPNHFAEKSIIHLGEAGREIWELDALRWERIPLKTQLDPFDLTLKVVRLGDRDYGVLDYNTELFQEETMARFVVHFQKMLVEVLRDPDLPLERVPLQSAEEQARLAAFNATEKPYPNDATIHGLFEAQVERTPERVALEFGGLSMSYRALDERAEQLAERLRERGQGPGQVVAVMLERCFDLPIALFAVLKAGCAYLPIDPHLPTERIAHTLRDSQATVLLTHERWLADLVDIAAETLALDRPELYREQDLTLAAKVARGNWKAAGPRDPAYVIYTSGSTGLPKGAVIEHHSAVNRIVWMHQSYGLGLDEAILQKTPFTFDVSVWELFWWSWYGARLVLAPPGAEKDPETLLGLMERHSVNLMHFVPSMLSAFLAWLDAQPPLVRESLASLRLVFASGEALTPRQVQDFQRLLGPNTQLHNLYGPTEATVDVSYFDCNRSKSEGKTLTRIPIGKPIDNIQLHVLNRAHQPQPLGAPGELFIAGVGLARGYLNRPELTAQRFVDNPFQVGTKMYATGDLARWLPDGNLEFLGRLDHQVKIRGYRIELGEIEARLLQHPQIEQALVTDFAADQGSRELVAYYQAAPKLDLSLLRAFLRQHLPDYMIPAYFVRLDSFPLGATGKIDRKALPAPRQLGQSSLEPPADAVEAHLLKLWKELLGLECVGVCDNFYLLGGHSLKAIRLGTQIQRDFQVRVPLNKLLERPTIREMRNLIGLPGEDAEAAQHAPIPKAPTTSHDPLSAAQRRLYILHKLAESQDGDPDAVLAYNMPEALLIEGNLDLDRLEHAFRALIERHPILRTRFEWIEGEPRQRIEAEVFFHLTVRDLSETWLQDRLAHFTRPFDLEVAPLMRAELVRLTAERQVLLFDMHHIITDEVSKTLLARELSALVAESALAPTPSLEYRDYAHWQAAQLDAHREQTGLLAQGHKTPDASDHALELGVAELKQAFAAGLEYWRGVFSEPLPVLQLESERPYPAKPSSKGASYEFHLDAATSGELRSLAARFETTAFTVLLSLFQVQLSFLSGQEDLCVGTPVIGRPPAFENSQGLFVNTLALRAKLPPGKRFSALLAEQHRQLLAALQHQEIPFERVLALATQARPGSAAGGVQDQAKALFDCFFVLQNEVFQLELPGLKTTPLKLPLPAAKFDLLLGGLERDGLFGFAYQYRTDLWSEGRIARLAEQFRWLLRQVIDAPHGLIGELEKVTPAENERLTHDFNDTELAFDRSQTIGARFAQVAAQFPDKTALVWRSESLSYAELDAKSNRLAHAILAEGVAAGAVVAVLSERDPWMVISVLAALKAGAAYLPLDPSHPAQRLLELCQRAGAGLLLVRPGLLEEHAIDSSLFPLPILDPQAERENWPLHAPHLEGDGDDLAYLIFTSGSTGQPKGVMVQHRNLLNLRLFFERGFYQVRPNDVSIQFAPFTFDASAGELFMSLLNGCTLHLLPNEVIGNFAAFEDYLTEHGVSFAALPPAYLAHLRPERLPRLRILMSAGSAPGPELMNRWASRLAFVNAYGPTETTIISTAWSSAGQNWSGGRVPIGKPVFNTRVYILDAQLRLQPIGVSGELYLAGDGLALGYLNMPEATQSAFVQNPHRPGERIYRTGDFARWRLDGNLEFIGRKDDQIKIRGHRIELGEITRVLEECPLVAEAAVVDREDDSGQKYLCAYFVVKANKALPSQTARAGADEAGLIRKTLAERLPSYMLPAHLLQLTRIPLTPNGKLDRKALPEPVAMAQEQVAPRNGLESELLKIWARVLHQAKLGIHDDFFERGGQSLKAIQLASAVGQELGYQLKLADVFQHPTIAALARFLQESPNLVAQRRIPHAEERPFYPLAPPQRRIYLLEQLEGPGTHYLIPALFRVRGRFLAERLPAAIQRLLERQEALRIAFHDSDEGPLFQVLDDLPVEAILYNCAKLGRRELIETAMAPFQLVRAPLWRLCLGADEDGTPLMMLVIHHLIADGWGMERLLEQLFKAYAGEDLEEPPLRYRDYAVWSSDRLASGALASQEAYWTQLYRRLPAALELPLDQQRPAEQRFEGARLPFQLSPHQLASLESFARQESASLFMLLLAAQAVLLGKWCNSEDLVIGTPIAGRETAELEQIVGLFVNTLALRIKPRRELSPRQLLRELRTHSLEAHANQDYPFELLVDRLRLPRVMNRNPLFDSMFILQNRSIPEVFVDDAHFEPLDPGYEISKFDLTLEALREQDRLLFVLTYASSLFTAESAARLVEDYCAVLDGFVEQPDQPLSELRLGATPECAPSSASGPLGSGFDAVEFDF